MALGRHSCSSRERLVTEGSIGRRQHSAGSPERADVGRYLHTGGSRARAPDEHHEHRPARSRRGLHDRAPTSSTTSRASVGINFYAAFVIAVAGRRACSASFSSVSSSGRSEAKPDQALVLSIRLDAGVPERRAWPSPAVLPSRTTAPSRAWSPSATLALSIERVVIIVAGFVLIVALFLFIRFAKNGQAMLAISQDREGAALQGININRLSAIAMFVGCALAGVAGGLVGALFTLTPDYGRLGADEGHRGHHPGRTRKHSRVPWSAA